jgi:hypothetical protein
MALRGSGPPGTYAAAVNAVSPAYRSLVSAVLGTEGQFPLPFCCPRSRSCPTLRQLLNQCQPPARPLMKCRGLLSDDPRLGAKPDEDPPICGMSA